MVCCRICACRLHIPLRPYSLDSLFQSHYSCALSFRSNEAHADFHQFACWGGGTRELRVCALIWMWCDVRGARARLLSADRDRKHGEREKAFHFPSSSFSLKARNRPATPAGQTRNTCGTADTRDNGFILSFILEGFHGEILKKSVLGAFNHTVRSSHVSDYFLSVYLFEINIYLTSNQENCNTKI